MKDSLVKILKSIGFPVSSTSLGEEIFENDNKCIIFFDIGDINFKLIRIDDLYFFCYILCVYSPIEDGFSIIKYARIAKDLFHE